MIVVRRRQDRGHFNHGWLDTWHTFSFGEYHDPQWMGFRQLRVINEDFVAGGEGFPTHPHRDMEIVTYVLEGALSHKDSMGNGSVIQPGEVQRMSAGTGVTHSEANAADEQSHFYQIWIIPAQRGLAPSYEQRRVLDERARGQLRLIAGPDGGDGAVTIHQDVRVYATVLEGGQRVTHKLAPGRHAWVQTARGRVTIAEPMAAAKAIGAVGLVAGDGAAISDEPTITLMAAEPSEVLVFDLA